MTDQLPQYPVQASVQSEAGRWSLRLERDIAHSPRDYGWQALATTMPKSELARVSLPGWLGEAIRPALP